MSTGITKISGLGLGVWAMVEDGWSDPPVGSTREVGSLMDSVIMGCSVGSPSSALTPVMMVPVVWGVAVLGPAGDCTSSPSRLLNV